MGLREINNPKKAFLDIFMLFYKRYEKGYNDIYAIFKEDDTEFVIEISDSPYYLCKYLAGHQPKDLEKIRGTFQALGLNLDNELADGKSYREPIGFIVGFHETWEFVGDEEMPCDYHSHIRLGLKKQDDGYQLGVGTLDKLYDLGKTRSVC